jgi:hypothetical protein
MTNHVPLQHPGLLADDLERALDTSFREHLREPFRRIVRLRQNEILRVEPEGDVDGCVAGILPANRGRDALDTCVGDGLILRQQTECRRGCREGYDRDSQDDVSSYAISVIEVFRYLSEIRHTSSEIEMWVRDTKAYRQSLTWLTRRFLCPALP